MKELKPCPFHNCNTCGCYDSVNLSDKVWNFRPIEDALAVTLQQKDTEIAEIKFLLAFALYGLGKITYESWHTTAWVNDEIWTTYKDKAHEVMNEYGKKHKQMINDIHKLREALNKIVYYEPTVKTGWDTDDQALVDIANTALDETYRGKRV